MRFSIPLHNNLGNKGCHLPLRWIPCHAGPCCILSKLSTWYENIFPLPEGTPYDFFSWILKTNRTGGVKACYWLFTFCTDFIRTPFWYSIFPFRGGSIFEVGHQGFSYFIDFGFSLMIYWLTRLFQIWQRFFKNFRTRESFFNYFRTCNWRWFAWRTNMSY